MANIQRQGLRSWRLESDGPALAASVHLVGGPSKTNSRERNQRRQISRIGKPIGSIGANREATSQWEVMNAPQRRENMREERNKSSGQQATSKQRP